MLKVILIGAGDRGMTYTDIMYGNDFKVVGVAEPIRERREYVAQKHGIAPDMVFESWEDLLALPKCADLAVIATMDRDHYAPTMKAIELGYDMLLEKPVCPTAKECVEIREAAKAKGVKILVCHVLRYSPFFRTLKDLVDSGIVGRIINIEHNECVWNLHQSHSFVRGNWGNSDRSSCMILQKCCHDMDILQWLIGKKCSRVHSFGSLTYFTRENCPEGAPDYCVQGCPHSDECCYDAIKVYVKDEENLWFREACTQKKKPTNEEVMEAISTNNYGRCVFKCDNNVVDHQVVNLEFEDGATVSFNMCAFNAKGRSIRIMGTKGELVGNMDCDTIDFFNFLTQKHEKIPVSNAVLGNTIAEGHGGGDKGIVNVLHKYLTEGYNGDMLSEIDISVQNHLIAFAAEKSRVEGIIVDMEQFEKELLGAE